ncbi:MAG: CaiB/BaiF CoA-transferase family protein [Pseudomonadota bacterium]
MGSAPANDDPPLKGLKVLELARILAGPWAGQVLADLGATVIKVESPLGDDTRSWGPPFIDRDGDRSAAYFYACNRGKQAVAADFKNDDDLRFVTELAGEADVLIENFKVGGLDKYGLDYGAVSKRNPRIIYASITGFGQNGPYADRPGYDFLLQAMSGLMSITGDAAGEPQKVGVAVTDLFTGLYAVIGIQAALHERQKSGRGQHIDLSLFDAATAMLANQATNYLASGESPHRMGNAHPNIVPYQVFHAMDGPLVIAVGNDEQFKRLCDVLGRQDLALDSRFQTNAGRVAARDKLIAALESEIVSWQKDKLLTALEKATIPAAPVNTVADALNDPQLIERDMLIEPDAISGLRTPLQFSRSSLASETTAPVLPVGENERTKPHWPRDKPR